MPYPLDLVPLPRSTDRLVLRRFDPSDVPAIFAYRSLPQAHEWIGSAVTSVEALAERFGTGPTAVVIELDGQVVGDLMVRVRDAWGQTEVADRAAATEAELGWTFDPAHQGQGLATEAVRELVQMCFVHLGLHRVFASCFTDNEPSWRLMERIGMRREAHHVKDSLHRDRGWLDEYVYALLAEEWPVRGVV